MNLLNIFQILICLSSQTQISFGAYNKVEKGQSSPLMGEIAQNAMPVFIWMGDAVYIDRPFNSAKSLNEQNLTLIQSKYKATKNEPNYQEL